MASAAFYSVPTAPSPFLRPIPRHHRSSGYIRCGRRDNRGPLVKGRILSIEAIQAIQSLKRAHRSLSSPSQPAVNAHHLPSLSRLIKSDLLAVLRELLRQDECSLALRVLFTLQSEYPPLELGLAADVVAALARNGMTAEIDRLVLEIEEVDCDDEKALVRLIKGLIAAERKESTVRVCALMRRGGVGSGRTVGEYVVRVLGRGLRRFGDEAMALEVERDFGTAGLTTITSGGRLNRTSI